MLLLLRRRERLRYFVSEFLFKGRRPLLGSSIHASETTHKINTVNIKYWLVDLFDFVQHFIHGAHIKLNALISLLKMMHCSH